MDTDSSDKDIKKIEDDHNAAASIVRSKLDRIYGEEPNVEDEIAKVKNLEEQHKHLSKHQKYMDKLTNSGRSLAEIQTAWHDYYQKLPDREKHEVWQEFYAAHEKKREKAKQDAAMRQQVRTQTSPPQPLAPIYGSEQESVRPNPKDEIVKKVRRRAQKSQKNPHAHSLIFGLSIGAVVVFIMMFGFFNERFITPFIRPSVNVSATPIIVDPNTVGDVGPEPKIIIPKINVEAPVVYDEPSIDEKAIQKALERGVVHYAITPNPGEKGNSVIVGHSSSNILNSGKYKFAFLLLKSLENDDTFIVQKDGKKYVYKVYNKFSTTPDDVSVLNPTDRPATMTLITCDPPGSSKNRLIIQAVQIFPDPNANKASSVNPDSQKKPQELGGNSPSLWSRLWDWL